MATFRWRAADPKANTEVVLLIAGQEKPVLLAKATGGAYRVPAKLLPETEYVWTVKYGGDEVGTGKFRTLSSAALAQVEMRRPGDKADFSDRLLFALMLQEMGAVQEARESWSRLAQERSDLPELAAFAKDSRRRCDAFAPARGAGGRLVAFVADLSNATTEGDGKLNFLAGSRPAQLLLGTGARVAVTYARPGRN